MPPNKNRGRPAVDPEKLKKKINLMFSPPVIAYLDAVAMETGISKSAIVENHIRIQMRKDGGDPRRAAKTSDD